MNSSSLYSLEIVVSLGAFAYPRNELHALLGPLLLHFILDFVRMFTVFYFSYFRMINNLKLFVCEFAFVLVHFHSLL